MCKLNRSKEKNIVVMHKKFNIILRDIVIRSTVDILGPRKFLKRLKNVKIPIISLLIAKTETRSANS